MKIHEYQAKEVFRRFGLPVPNGKLAKTADEAYDIAKWLGTTPVVVKAQIHAGGRGKGGGVKLAQSPEEARERAKDILGMMLKTKQTGPEGQLVRKVYIEEGSKIARELYFAITLDRETSRVTLMASAEGGVDIEEVAAKTPEKIFRVGVDPVIGLRSHHARDMAQKLGMTGKTVNEAVKVLQLLYKTFVDTDASLLEVNPLIVTKDGGVVCLDGKMQFDENALFRHNEIVAMRDLDEEDPKEIEAKKYDLSYIALDGTIGCLVNGAGLAMATMDIIKNAGGNPANFLDVGGGATTEKVTAAFKIILTDPKVKAIFVNIFGGIMKCDVIAQGVITAAKELGLKVPVVVRMEGTNVELGRKMLQDSGLAIQSANDMLDGAKKVVVAAGK
ncbi:MAG: ADP-forming succinate--CoA ligase subunit beta [Deltaproteobacteria bacterium]|nr:ADP-forming succinate--CoA ligase subunit beta [Deltaproteobacteria bacterium]